MDIPVDNNECVRGWQRRWGKGRKGRALRSRVSEEEVLFTLGRVPWDRSQGSPEGGRASGWERIGSTVGPLAHLRDLDSVGLLDETGGLVIGIGHQDRDFFCHLRRGKGDRSWGSETFWATKGQWPLIPQAYVSARHLSFFMPSLPLSLPRLFSSLLLSFFYSFMQQLL